MTPWVGPVWTLDAWLVGFIKRSNKHCYTHNIKPLCLVVSEKKIFLCFPIVNLAICCHGNQSSCPKPNVTIPPSFYLNLNSGKHIKLSILQKTRKLVQLQL